MQGLVGQSDASSASLERLVHFYILISERGSDRLTNRQTKRRTDKEITFLEDASEKFF